MKQDLYSCEAIDRLVDSYIRKGGEVHELEEGCLGYGLLLLTGENLKSIVVREVYINEWSSGHSIRMYNKCPKKYMDLLERKTA